MNSKLDQFDSKIFPLFVLSYMKEAIPLISHKNHRGLTKKDNSSLSSCKCPTPESREKNLRRGAL